MTHVGAPCVYSCRIQPQTHLHFHRLVPAPADPLELDVPEVVRDDVLPEALTHRLGAAARELCSQAGDYRMGRERSSLGPRCEHTLDNTPRINTAPKFASSTLPQSCCLRVLEHFIDNERPSDEHCTKSVVL